MPSTDHKFLEEAPEGFDPTMELKWVKQRLDPYVELLTMLSPSNENHKLILCQKYRGAFRDVWVRVPIDE